MTDGWQAPGDAPTNETVIAWGGGGGYRFMRKDELGQWRSMMGLPRQAPRWWLPIGALPALPPDSPRPT